MARVSRKEADKHRSEVIRAAARLIPEHGIDGVSVPALMAEAGLTHGAFYGHFPSKEALMVAACGEAFAEKCAHYDEIAARFSGGDDTEAARAVFIKRYTRMSVRGSIAACGKSRASAARVGARTRLDPRHKA